MKGFNFYYMLWADAINSYKEKYPKAKTEKMFWDIFFLITVANIFNVVTLSLVIGDILDIDIKFRLNFMPNTKTDDMLSGFLQFFLPVAIINYLLIFRKDRYKKITKKYTISGGKFTYRYSMGSIYVLVGYVIFKVIWRNFFL